jgi:hypothetical protein
MVLDSLALALFPVLLADTLELNPKKLKSGIARGACRVTPSVPTLLTLCVTKNKWVPAKIHRAEMKIPLWFPREVRFCNFTPLHEKSESTKKNCQKVYSFDFFYGWKLELKVQRQIWTNALILSFFLLLFSTMRQKIKTQRAIIRTKMKLKLKKIGITLEMNFNKFRSRK